MSFRNLLAPLALLFQLMSSPALAEIWLGMEVGRVPPNTAAVHDLAPGAGAHIAKVIPGSPADQAGLESGDIILRMNYRPVRGPGSISGIAQNLQAGQSVPVQILRYGKIMQIYIVPRPRGETPVESRY